MTNFHKRNLFADFLEKLLQDKSTNEEWFEYVVNHYHDEKLENFRRELVRLRQSSGEVPFTNEQQSIIRS